MKNIPLTKQVSVVDICFYLITVFPLVSSVLCISVNYYFTQRSILECSVDTCRISNRNKLEDKTTGIFSSQELKIDASQTDPWWWVLRDFFIFYGVFGMPGILFMLLTPIDGDPIINDVSSETFPSPAPTDRQLMLTEAKELLVKISTRVSKLEVAGTSALETIERLRNRHHEQSCRYQNLLNFSASYEQSGNAIEAKLATAKAMATEQILAGLNSRLQADREVLASIHESRDRECADLFLLEIEIAWLDIYISISNELDLQQSSQLQLQLQNIHNYLECCNFGVRATNEILQESKYSEVVASIDRN
jgi:hypothetical protein